MGSRPFFELAVVLTLLPTAAYGAVATIGASKDNSIYQSAPNNSAGGAAGIFSGGNGAGSPRRGLLAFDIAANVPAGATIHGAQLILHLGAASSFANPTIGLHRLTADWGEGTAGSTSPTVGGGGSGFAAGPGDATWNERFSGSTAWANPGATGDFSPVASAALVVGNTLDGPDYVWGSTAALVGDVQQWLDNPAANFGWSLVNANEGSSGSVRAFYSRSAMQNSQGNPLDPSWRPRLIVDYSFVPEPTAAALLLLAASPAVALRRRHKQVRIFA